MKNNLLQNLTATLALSVSALTMTASNAFAGAQDFVVRNQTGTGIVRLYVSESNTNDWEEDVLGRGTIEAGNSARINFNSGTQGCLHDLKAVFRDGDVLERRELNLCTLRTYTFTN